MNIIDRLLNKITMYRLTLYVLLAITVWASITTFFGAQAFTFWQLFWSFWVLLAVSYVSNIAFAKIFRVTPNVESVYITSFILTLIVTPASDSTGYMFLVWVALIAMASKYLLSINRRHVFNPAAFAVVVTIYVLNMGASWWVGSLWMFPVVLLGGALLVRKTQRWDMVFWFLAATTVSALSFAVYRGTDVVLVAKALYLYSATVFFATVMLTEPLTSPTTKRWQIVYGLLVGILFSPFTHVGSFYFTPELALVAGNIFALVVGPRSRYVLTLKEKLPIGHGLYDFVFTTEKKIRFAPGQYLEWTLSHSKRDARGNRRYFTISSSPTENEIRMGVKFYDPSSSYKKALLAMKAGDKILAGQLAGDFVLPKSPQEKSVFIAGGIGITPFRSMVKYLVDTRQKRDVVLLYSNKTRNEIVYEDVFRQAEPLGLKTVYTLTQENWAGERGWIDSHMIKKYIADYQTRRYYISGTHSMVSGMEKILREMGIPKKHITTDFFPGF